MKKCIISIILIVIFIFSLELPHYTLADVGDLFSPESADEFKPSDNTTGTLEEPIVNAIVTIANGVLRNATNYRSNRSSSINSYLWI